MEANCVICGRFALCGLCCGNRVCEDCWLPEMSVPSDRRQVELSEVAAVVAASEPSVSVNCSNNWN